MWIYYSVAINDVPMIVRSSTELTLLSISSIYIVNNKIKNYNLENVKKKQNQNQSQITLV